MPGLTGPGIAGTIIAMKGSTAKWQKTPTIQGLTLYAVSGNTHTHTHTHTHTPILAPESILAFAHGLVVSTLGRGGTFRHTAPVSAHRYFPSDGLAFGDAFARAEAVDIEGPSIPVLSVPDIIKNKRASGRTKDLASSPRFRHVKAAFTHLAPQQANRYFRSSSGKNLAKGKAPLAGG